MAPSRKITGSSPLRSTTVDGALGGSSPASMMRSIISADSPSCSRISESERFGARPDTFADVAVNGFPNARASCAQKSFFGMRMPIVSIPRATPPATPSRFLRMTVSPPGKSRWNNSRASFVTSAYSSAITENSGCPSNASVKSRLFKYQMFHSNIVANLSRYAQILHDNMNHWRILHEYALKVRTHEISRYRNAQTWSGVARCRKTARYSKVNAQLLV